MKIRIFKDVKAVALYAATITEFVIETNEIPILGLATGATPVPLYQELARFHKGGLSFQHVRTINLDEYVGLGSTHPQSYRYFMNEYLFHPVDIPLDQTFVPDGTAVDLAAECCRYDDIIHRYPLDLQILGIGKNGHVGFNEPGLSLQAQTHVVKLSQDTILANAKYFSEIRDVPTLAITMGMQSILQAKRILLLATGFDKANAVVRAITGEMSTNMPASLLQLHQNVTFVLDEAAASQLSFHEATGMDVIKQA